ncbi:MULTISPECIES: DUF6685 family protein [Enterobacterales]|jgi:hypothetical protein|uniref:DUF6685 family protein n=1 Tax=Enterobacterales TaxID=91347 RepID=UPI001ED8C43C|nr:MULTISPECIES: DUF6685 family protein [Enterobacterales]WQD27595.1 DUF6685 family protein [Hafnia alvei]
MDHDIRDIDEFPVLRCRELAEPVTEEHLRKNMRHWELRLDRMLFAEYPWAERRLYYIAFRFCQSGWPELDRGGSFRRH